jgi:hypothetical protein
MYNTDPSNATFHGFKALNVQRLEIMEGDEINTRHFDHLIELIAPATEDVIIDNGASSFVPLSHYHFFKLVYLRKRFLKRFFYALFCPF